MHDMYNLIARVVDVRHGTVANLGAGTCASPISCQVPTINCMQLVNVEVFEPYVLILEKIRWTAKSVSNVKSDVVEWLNRVPSKTFDVVLLIDVLEHFALEVGKQVLAQSLRIATKQVLIWIPFGDCPQGAYDGNKYQEHLSTWKGEDFVGATAVEIFREAHKHFNPPCDAAWINYLMEVGDGED